MHTATRSHMRRTAARRRSQVSAPFARLSFPAFCFLYIMFHLSVLLTASTPCSWSVLPFLWVADSAWRHFQGKHAMSRENDTSRDIHQLR